MLDTIRKKWNKSKDETRADWSNMVKEFNLDQHKIDMQGLFLLMSGWLLIMIGAILTLLCEESKVALLLMQLGCAPIMIFMAWGVWLNLRWWWHKRTKKLEG